jgi:Resolvase, N terminal domain
MLFIAHVHGDDALATGDTIVVWKLDRLARSTRDLLETMEAIREAGENFSPSLNPGLLIRQLTPARIDAI